MPRDGYYEVSGYLELRRRRSGGNGVVDAQVSVGADDGYYEAVLFKPSSSLIQVGDVAGTLREGWYRFDNITIPQGAIIDVAYISGMARANSGGVGTATNLFMEDADDAVAPVDRADVAGKTRTTASVAWDDDTLTINQFHDSPSIVAVVKEIVDRGSWASGNAMQVLHDDDGSGASNFFDFKSIENQAANAMKLHVEWSS